MVLQMIASHDVFDEQITHQIFLIFLDMFGYDLFSNKPSFSNTPPQYLSTLFDYLIYLYSAILWAAERAKMTT